MARQSEFIDKLTDFTRSLDSLVELLKEQQKFGPTEVVNQLLENIDGEAIASIAKNLQSVKENTITINKNVEKTLEAVKSLKKEKKNGMFDQLEDKKGKKTITEGIKTVILIAAGVLAIGLAFKIIGKVDFLSVVALGMGIVFVAMAFAQVASIRDKKGKPITWQHALFTAGLMVLMAGALVAAGWILKLMPSLSFTQLAGVVGIGLGIGLGTYFLINGLSKLKPKQLLLMLGIIPLIPILLPAIALGIVAAGLVLRFMPTIGFKQLLSAIGVSIALAPMALAVGYLAKGIKNAKMEDIMMVGFVIPIIALGLVAASLILRFVSDIPFMKVIKAGIAIGIAVLMMTPTLYILKKAGLLNKNAKSQLINGVEAIILISGAIMLSSWIISAGNYTNTPDWKWALGAGLSIILFTPAFAILAIVSKKFGVGLNEYAESGLAMLIIAGVIMLTSYILGAGSYGNYPSWQWALGSGLAMLAFGISMIVIGTLMLLAGGAIGFEILGLGAAAMLIIAATVMITSYILGAGSYGNFPTWEWSLGSGLAMVGFGMSMMIIGTIILLSGGLGFAALALGAVAVLLIAATVVAASYILGAGSYGNYPSWEWSLGSGLAMVGFGMAMLTLGTLILLSFGLGFIALEVGAFAVLLVAQTVVETSYILAKGDYKDYPSWSWIIGVGANMIAFGGAMLYLGPLFPIMAVGALAILMVAGTIWAVDKILADSEYKKYPSLDWMLSIGAIVTTFAVGMILLSEIFPFIVVGSMSMLMIAGTIWALDKILTNGDYKKYPSLDWITGVVGIITLFGAALVGFAIGFANLFGLVAIAAGGFVVLAISGIIVTVSQLLSMGNYEKYPSLDWVNGVAKSLLAFIEVGGQLLLTDISASTDAIMKVAWAMFDYSKVMNLIAEGGFDAKTADSITTSLEKLIKVLPKQSEIDPLWSLINALTALSEVSWSDLFSMDAISYIIGNLADEISKIDNTKVESLAKIGTSLHIISLIDQEKLKEALSLIEAKSSSISAVVSDSGFATSMFNQQQDTIAGKGLNPQGSQQGVISQPGQAPQQKSGFEEELLKYVKSIDDNISKMVQGSEEKEQQEKLKFKDVED